MLDLGLKLNNNLKINKMKRLFLFLVIAFVGFPSMAQEVKKNKNAKYAIEVNGNCEHCQKRIQKAALSVAGVKQATWDIESHQLSLILNEEKCSVVDVKKAVAKVGHDTDEAKTAVETYDKLPNCCKYSRK
jgi:periplasmic mercuric ion binding protein